MREHAEYLRFTPESDREGLTKLIFGLYDTSELVGKRLGLAEACVDLLTLRSYDSRAKSYAMLQCNLMVLLPFGQKTYTILKRFDGVAKVVRIAGATAGTAILPGIGTAIGGAAGGLALGIVGAVAGDAFAEWVIDITFVGE